MERAPKGDGTYTTETKKDGSIRYVFRVKIKGRVYKKRFKTIRDGRKWAREQNNKSENGRLENPNRVLFKNYIPHWYDHSLARVGRKELKESVLKDYMGIVNRHLLPAFGNMKLTNITVSTLNTFFDSTLKKANGERHAPNTIRNVRRVLDSIMKLARIEHYIGFNPVRELPPIKGANANTRTSLTSEESKELLEGAKAYYEKKKGYKNTNVSIYPFLCLVLNCGVRIGEALALQWDDIDTQENTIRINKALNKEGQLQTPKTQYGYRVLSIKPEIIELCLSFNDGVSTYLFHTKTGTPISIHNMERGLRAVLKFAHIERKALPHELRHTAATAAINNGANIVDVQHMLGHAKASTTLDFYTHGTKESTKRASEAVQKGIDFPV